MSRDLERRMLAGIAVVLLVSGCQVEAPRPKGPVVLKTSRIGSGFAPIWINRDLRPIGQLTAVGSTMVGLVVENRRLYVVAIDPATGNVRWRQQTTPSWITPGVEMEIIQIGDDKIAYFRPDARYPDYAQLVVADAATGRDLSISTHAGFTALPYACTDGHDVCAISRPMGSGRKHQYRLEIAADSYGLESEALPPNTRVLEPPSLLDLGDRPGNTLGWLRDGTIRWRIPVSAAFPPGFSSDNGWTWREFADARVIVGSVYGPPLARTPKIVADLASGSATAGISVATGEVLWSDSGSSLQCNLGKGSFPVRCRWRGIVTTPPGGPSSFENLDVTIEGFEPATGRTTWSVPMGPAHALADFRMQRVVAGMSKAVLTGPNGPIVLDYATGSVTAPSAGASFWCMSRIDYEMIPGFTAWDGKLRYDRPGGELAASCDEQGRPSEELPGVESTTGAGAHVSGYAVIAGRNRYIGFQVP